MGGQTGATSEPTTSWRLAMLSARRFRSSSVESMLVCGEDKNKSTPSNRMPSTSACRRQVQHGFQVDERFRVWSLAYEPRPHRVVDCRVLVLICCAHDPSAYFRHSGCASGLPGPKCFSRTSGSDALGFSMRTPSLATSAVTNTSSSVISPKRIMDGVDTGCLPSVP